MARSPARPTCVRRQPALAVGDVVRRVRLLVRHGLVALGHAHSRRPVLGAGRRRVQGARGARQAPPTQHQECQPPAESERRDLRHGAARCRGRYLRMETDPPGGRYAARPRLCAGTDGGRAGGGESVLCVGGGACRAEAGPLGRKSGTRAEAGGKLSPEEAGSLRRGRGFWSEVRSQGKAGLWARSLVSCGGGASTRRRGLSGGSQELGWRLGAGLLDGGGALGRKSGPVRRRGLS